MVDGAPGAPVAWGADHGGEGLYVVSGSLEVDSKVCLAGGAIVVESGVPAIVTVRSSE